MVLPGTDLCAPNVLAVGFTESATPEVQATCNLGGLRKEQISGNVWENKETQ